MAYEITARTPAGAAKQLHRHLLKICEGTGQSSKYVTIRNPQESEYGGWEVMWEEGPFEWAIAASMGGDIYEIERQGTLYRNPPTFPGMYETKAERTWFAEPGFSFSLGFYRR